MNPIYLFGLLSFLADTIYEGGRSLIPVVLKGYSLEAFGILSGIAEGSGYLLRAISGILADKLSAHWLFMAIGYSLVLSYPLSALLPTLSVFIIAIIVERIGKAIRNPARDALLASVAEDPGKAFAIVEMMDQLGAVLGPSLAFALLLLGFEAKRALLLYLIPGFLLFIPLFMLRKIKPRPRKKEVVWKGSSIVIFSFFIGLTFAQPILVAASGKSLAPLVYAVAMLSDALFAYPLGLLKGKKAILSAVLLAPASLSIRHPFLAPYAGAAIAYTEVTLRALIAEAGGKGKLYGLAFAALGFGSLIGGVVMPMLNDLELLIYSLAVASTGVIITLKSSL